MPGQRNYIKVVIAIVLFVFSLLIMYFVNNLGLFNVFSGFISDPLLNAFYWVGLFELLLVVLLLKPYMLVHSNSSVDSLASTAKGVLFFVGAVLIVMFLIPFSSMLFSFFGDSILVSLGEFCLLIFSIISFNVLPEVIILLND